MPDQRQQRDIPAQESMQLLNSPDDSQATTSKLQQMDDRDRSADFLDQIEVQFEALIQESGIDVEAIKSEYKRAVAESKEAYKDALSWRSVEHSNLFQDAFGRLLAFSCDEEGHAKSRPLQFDVQGGREKVWKTSNTVYMDSSPADHLYEIAHNEAFVGDTGISRITGSRSGYLV
jgi:hypothetical protein